MDGILVRVECYIEGEENNIDNKTKYVKEHAFVAFDSSHQNA